MTKDTRSIRPIGLARICLSLMLPIGLSLGAVGCSGPDAEALCEELASCEGGNDMDAEACVANFDAARDFMSDLGCGDEYDDYWECFIEEASCQSESIGTSCNVASDCGYDAATCEGGECMYKDYDLKDDDDCEEVYNAYHECIDIL